MSFDKKYFQSQNYEKVTFKKYSMYWWSNRFFSILVKRLLKRGRVIELGCGLGDLIKNLDNGNYELTGVDVSRYAISKAKAKCRGAKFILSDIESLDFYNNSFDLVLAKHSLEHLNKPSITLRKASRWLRPGGILIMATPNLNCVLRGLKGNYWHGFTDKTHISLMKPLEWFDLLEKNGFVVIKSFSDGFWNVPYFSFVPAWLQKVTLGLPGGIQALLGVTCLPVPLGESLIIVARKTSFKN